MDVRTIEITEPTGETVAAYVIPDGYCCVLVPEDQAAECEDWRDCTGIRMAPASDDGRVALLELEGPA
jgi:hypothetical protein